VQPRVDHLLEAGEVAALIEACRAAFDITWDCEVTLEANPESVSVDTLRAYRDAGVNRLSFGVQSFREPELRRLTRLHDQLEALARRLEERALAVREAALGTAHEVEETITLRVRRLEARAMLLRAKARTTRAVTAASKEEFDRAEEYLEDATELLRTARATLGEDHVYDRLFDAVKDSLRSASHAVRVHAENVREKIETVLADTDRLVGRLEADEQRDSERTMQQEEEDLRAAA